MSSGNDAGGVAVFGGGGLLTSDKRMSWNTQTGTLTVPRLQALEVKTPQRRVVPGCVVGERCKIESLYVTSNRRRNSVL